MSHLVASGLGMIASLTPTAGYTAVVLNTLVLNSESTSMADVLKLGVAGLLVAGVTAPMISWVLKRLGKVSDDLVKAKEDQQSKEMTDVKKDIEEIRQAIRGIRDILMRE